MVNFHPIMHFDGNDDFLEGHDFSTTTENVNMTITNRSASSEFVDDPGGLTELTFGADRSVL
jgi:hypothetical protein